MPKITVVFDYIEGAELPRKLTAAFATETMAFGDANISAISMVDEISRVEELERGLDETIDSLDSMIDAQGKAWDEFFGEDGVEAIAPDAISDISH